MKLNEFHIRKTAFGPVGHGHAISSGYGRIGCCHVDLPGTTSREDRNAAYMFFDIQFIGVQHIGAVALDVGSHPRNIPTQVMLSDEIYSVIILKDLYVGKDF